MSVIENSIQPSHLPFLLTGLAFSKPYLVTFLEQRKEPWNIKGPGPVAAYAGMWEWINQSTLGRGPAMPQKGMHQKLDGWIGGFFRENGDVECFTYHLSIYDIFWQMFIMLLFPQICPPTIVMSACIYSDRSLSFCRWGSGSLQTCHCFLCLRNLCTVPVTSVSSLYSKVSPQINPSDYICVLSCPIRLLYKLL